MKKIASILLLLFAANLHADDVPRTTDPVRDYIETLCGKQMRSTNLPPVETEWIPLYSDDRLFRLDIDIDGDGVKEVLLSLGSSRYGARQGLWAVYKKMGDKYRWGNNTVRFPADCFYVGPVDELQGRFGIVALDVKRQYGVISMGQDENPEPVVYAQISGQDHRISRLQSDGRDTRPTVVELVVKYLTDRNAAKVHQAQELPIADLAKEYGLEIRKETYAQHLANVEKDLKEERWENEPLSEEKLVELALAAIKEMHKPKEMKAIVTYDLRRNTAIVMWPVPELYPDRPNPPGPDYYARVFINRYTGKILFISRG